MREWACHSAAIIFDDNPVSFRTYFTNDTGKKNGVIEVLSKNHLCSTFADLIKLKELQKTVLEELVE